MVQGNQKYDIVGDTIGVLEELLCHAPRGIRHYPADFPIEPEKVRASGNLQGKDIRYAVVSECTGERTSAFAGFKNSSADLREKMPNDALRKLIWRINQITWIYTINPGAMVKVPPKDSRATAMEMQRALAAALLLP